MAKFKQGDRVNHFNFGHGTVIGVLESDKLPFDSYYVKWDKENKLTKILQNFEPIAEYSLQFDERWLRENKIDKLLNN